MVALSPPDAIAAAALAALHEAWPTPRATLLRFADQALQRLASVRACGLVHGNIKPGKFLTAFPAAVSAGEPPIYLIDMETAETGGSWRSKSPVCRELFFASAAALRGRDCATRDDIEALAYCVADLAGGRMLLSWASKPQEEQCRFKRILAPSDLFCELGGADAGICAALIRFARCPDYRPSLAQLREGDRYSALRRTLVRLAFEAGPEVASAAGAASPDAATLDYSGPAGAWQWVPSAPRRRPTDPIEYWPRPLTAARMQLPVRRRRLSVLSTVAVRCSKDHDDDDDDFRFDLFAAQQLLKRRSSRRLHGRTVAPGPATASYRAAPACEMRHLSTRWRLVRFWVIALSREEFELV